MSSSAGAERRESSVLFSLRELQSIEARRVEEDARLAREREAAREQARRAEEERARAAEAVRLQREADAAAHAREIIALRVREEELRVREAEARARAEHDAAIESQRLAQEMAVRRLEASRKRPTWLVAAVGASVLVAAIAVYVTVDHIAATNRAEQAASTANAKRVAAIEAEHKAKRELARAKVELHGFESELGEIGKKLDAIEREIAQANTAAKRNEAEERAAQLRRREEQLRRDAERRRETLKVRCPPDKPLCD